MSSDSAVPVTDFNHHETGHRFALAMGFGMVLQFGAAAALIWPVEFSPAADALRHMVATGLVVVAAGASLLCALYAWSTSRFIHRQIKASRETASQIEELFAMTDMLQAADDNADAATVMMATAKRLLPDLGAALYIFNNSRDRLDLAKSWNLPDDTILPALLHPTHCWALKRGKPHINDPESGTLCCSHHVHSWGTVEIPMMARGTVHGLLVLHSLSGGAFEKLKAVRRLGRALADSMSLALSNITLREKLRTQSLRDPLTGLYNRRYMEDALERFLNLAARSGGSTAVIMIDLDDFKSLNDQQGHAKGDAVLRDVAAQILGSLRPTDVACRYGGEELIALLPDCSLENAMICAEKLRVRIEALSEAHQCPVTASFGVATVPETSTSGADVLPMADAALYAAKKAGKNCVHSSERRADGPALKPRLAKTAA